MLSIVIPTFNEEEYLPLLLSSIKNQSFKDYEIIIADNNSSDNTVSIANEFGAKIIRGGLPGAGRNYGAKHANGDLILFLDADVILYQRHFIRDIVNEFKSKNIGVATCEIFPLSSNIFDITSHKLYNNFITFTAPFIPHAPGFCILVNKDIHDAINGFDEEIRLGEDSDYVYRAARYTKFAILKSHQVSTSVRRFNKDGRLNIFVKYILCGLYMRVFGKVKTDIFNYQFGYKK